MVWAISKILELLFPVRYVDAADEADQVFVVVARKLKCVQLPLDFAVVPVGRHSLPQHVLSDAERSFAEVETIGDGAPLLGEIVHALHDRPASL